MHAVISFLEVIPKDTMYIWYLMVCICIYILIHQEYEVLYRLSFHWMSMHLNVVIVAFEHSL